LARLEGFDLQGVQLHQVVAGSHQIPLVGDLFQPTEQYEFSLPVVDLPEYGLAVVPTEVVNAVGANNT
jgi:hypothetical protein